MVTWAVLFDDAFVVEFEAFAQELQDELLAHARLLAEFGPNLGRPTVDTLRPAYLVTTPLEMPKAVAIC